MDVGGDQTAQVGDKVYLSGRLNNGTCNSPFETRCWVYSSGFPAPVFDAQGGFPARPSGNNCGGSAGQNFPTVSFTVPPIVGSGKVSFIYNYGCSRTVTGGSESLSKEVTVWMVDAASALKPSAFTWNRKHSLFGPQFDVRRSAFIQDGSAGAEVDLNVIETDVTSSASGLATIKSSNVPSYRFTLNRAVDRVRTGLVTHATSQFRAGATIPTIGQTIDFGQDVGFATTCAAGGSGWAAPDSICPRPAPVAFKIPIHPAPATRVCRLGSTSTGVLANGVLLRGQLGERSYRSENVWHDWASWLDSGNYDVCHGHTPPGDAYHHHAYSSCLAQQLNDAGTQHSPIYGYAADGYPIYGPWHANGVGVQSCWKTFSPQCPGNPPSQTLTRKCLLSNPEDINSSQIASPLQGPDTGDAVTGPDGVQILTFRGSYVEDYGFDPACPAQGPQYLDKYNGHDHDGLGYHYHLTVDGNMDPVYPGGPGPTYRGEIVAGATGLCN